MLDFTQKSWPIPDSSVDYIYSEDFIEHVPQRSQVAFLAEAFRVLKPGCYNRVSTPCLAASMGANSDFSKGIWSAPLGMDILSEGN
jgi:predicted SAM-dependent methyltransferase